jgi:ABC-type sulfate transport system substrate-binding protein
MGGFGYYHFACCASLLCSKFKYPAEVPHFKSLKNQDKLNIVKLMEDFLGTKVTLQRVSSEAILCDSCDQLILKNYYQDNEKDICHDCKKNFPKLQTVKFESKFTNS